MNDEPARSRRVKELAVQLGFARCGIAALGPLGRSDYVARWLAEGRAGTMGYLHRSRQTRLNPAELLPGTRSAIIAAIVYHQSEPPVPDSARRGRIARYAWGEDYHVVVRERLEELVRRMRDEFDEVFDAKVCVDTSPIIERELAAAAGVGWIGKNTLVLHEQLGSYFFLGEVLTTLELAPDAPAVDHCGTCTRCLEACPTQAFPVPYEMDARRCISYLTIEHRGKINPALRPAMADWVFGCDICQEVCPFNRDTPTTQEVRFAARPPAPRPTLDEIEAWDEAAYRAATNGRATDRATFIMWRRNAASARKNLGD